MKKEEIRQDPIKDKIIQSISYLDENRSVFINILVVIIILIGGLSYFNSMKIKSISEASAIAGIAQNSYNLNQSEIALNDMQKVMDNYSGTPSAIHSYIYLLKDSYLNNDTLRLNHLLNNYDINIADPILAQVVYELKANMSDSYNDKINNYKKAISFASESSIGRLEISLAQLYIVAEDYVNARDLLAKYLSDDAAFNLRSLANQLVGFIDSK